MYYHFPNELILMKDFQILQLAEIMTKRMDEHMTMSNAEQYKSYPLTEMAYERKMFKALLTNSSQQIIEKWCLVRYSTISGDKQEYASNWRKELIAYLSNAAINKIKGNNSVLSREKAISEVWVKEKEYSTDTNVINLTIHAKFQSEAIATNTKIYQQVLSDCANDAKNIIKVIAEASPEEITQYVSNI